MTYRITRVYTKQGDKGETKLGGGQTVAKHSLRIGAFGTVDELNTVLGIVLTCNPCPQTSGLLNTIQNELFVLGGDLCVLEEDKNKWPMQTVTEQMVIGLEKQIDEMNNQLKPLEEFILPGGTQAAAFLHHARCVCRRAERATVALAESEKVGEFVIPYLNRLSDLLFVMARFENKKSNLNDVYWQKSDSQK